MKCGDEEDWRGALSGGGEDGSEVLELYEAVCYTEWDLIFVFGTKCRCPATSFSGKVAVKFLTAVPRPRFSAKVSLRLTG